MFRCFLNVGVDVLDERYLKLHLLEYDNAKWVEHLEVSVEPSFFNRNVLAHNC